LQHSYFSVPYFEDLLEVVDVGQDKIQIVKLTGSLQKVDAAAAETGSRGSVAPPIHDLGGLGVSGRISAAHQTGGDPGAADLIFFAKFTPASGAD
jgi:hypothetical protein